MTVLPLDNAIVNRDTTLLWPVFLLKVQDALIDCRKRGLHVDIFEGYRSPSRQAWLYDQGRGRDGKIVTNAKPWESWHQYGCAVDIVFKDKSGNWNWSGDYDLVESVFISHSIERGPRFEHAHFELTGKLPLGIARGLAQGVGLQRVWMEIAAAIAK